MTQRDKVETMRRDFIANVSHELRTPLTVVGGFLETLSDMEGAIPANLKTYFTMMEDQTSRMRRIIEDLLTLSTLESKTESPDDHEINMASLLKSIQNDAIGLSQSLKKAPLQIHLHVDPIPVSYTHLDVYKRQHRAFTKTVKGHIQLTLTLKHQG